MSAHLAQKATAAAAGSIGGQFRLRREIAQLTEPAYKRLIFIAGAEGSGTTLLRRLLAALEEGLAPDTDRRCALELPSEAKAWLEAFFDARRRRQWNILEQAR